VQRPYRTYAGGSSSLEFSFFNQALRPDPYRFATVSNRLKLRLLDETGGCEPATNKMPHEVNQRGHEG